jgi:CRP-like cAMP-binding protein
MAKYLIRRLENFARLSAEDKRALEDAASQRVRTLAPREDIVHEGDRPRHVNLMLEGFACRYKMLADGRRQIVAIVVPGDMCDLRMFILKEMDHSIGALSPLKVAEIDEEKLRELTGSSVRLARALWWNSLVEEAIAREWTVNVGRRDALERMAHLLCEVFVRLSAVGLTNGNACELPLTQAELGDALGLSHVHTNRTLQELRARNLITLRGKGLIIHDLPALQDLALFNPNYLHLDREGREFDASAA